MNDIYLIILFPIILLIFCAPIVLLAYIAHPYHEQMREMMEKAFSKIDSEKQGYTSDKLKIIEFWKEQIRSIMGKYARNVFPKRQQAENLKQFKERLDLEIKNLKDKLEQPYLREEFDIEEKKQIGIGDILRSLFIFLCAAYSYLLVSAYQVGISFLTLFFAIACWPDGMPDKYSHEKINFKHSIVIAIIFILGYFLNKWTYAQSGEVQIAVTIALPILYGLIYYKLHHKKSVREL